MKDKAGLRKYTVQRPVLSHAAPVEASQASQVPAPPGQLTAEPVAAERLPQGPDQVRRWTRWTESNLVVCRDGNRLGQPLDFAQVAIGLAGGKPDLGRKAVCRHGAGRRRTCSDGPGQIEAARGSRSLDDEPASLGEGGL